MDKKIDLKKNVFTLCNEYPELIEILSNLGFTEITNKTALNTVGKIMTIPKGAVVKGINMVDVVLALKNNGFELEGKMPSFVNNKLKGKAEDKEEQLDDRTELLKSYVKRLTDGEDIESVRKDFVENFSEVDAGEIAKAEQALICSGTPIAEVQKLCDVHSALFHGATQQERIANAEKAVMYSLNGKQYGLGIGADEKTADIKRTDDGDTAYNELRKINGHPLYIFSKENEAIRQQIDVFKAALEERTDVADELDKTRELAVHYAEKGDLLYPVLKLRYGFSGPSDVMWGVDDEIRDDLKKLSNELRNDSGGFYVEDWENRVKAVITRAEEMIYKEENILFPLCAKNFSEKEWQDIARDMDDYKPCMIDKLQLWDKATPKQTIDEVEGNDMEIQLPSGHFTLTQLDAILNTLPMEITFIDHENINRYFNDGDEPKLFKRPLMALDREVFSCHPPKIEPMVRMIIDDFREGKRNYVDVWNTRDNEPVLVRYMAVRDKNKKYIGTMECVMKMGFAKEHFKA
nr:DUF438 domain-containing protein [uncultured Butyrivibrio sp.]